MSASGSVTIIGVDIGGTKTAIASYGSHNTEELSYSQRPTDASKGFTSFLDDIVGEIDKLRTADTRAVGVGIAGLVRTVDGHLLLAPNIPGGKGFPIKAALTEKIRLPVFVENDARCFALAEAVMGAGKGHRVVIGITMGTGVGGGIVVDGRIFNGEHGFAGEIGHMLLRPGEPPYPTDDKRGDVEQFFSGTAMGMRCEAAKKPQEYLEGQACEFLHPHLFREIAWLVTNLTYMFDPSVVVFGGSAGLALKPHLSEIEKELRQWTLPGTPLPELKTATVKHAGAVGAALLCGMKN